MPLGSVVHAIVELDSSVICGERVHDVRRESVSPVGIEEMVGIVACRWGTSPELDRRLCLSAA